MRHTKISFAFVMMVSMLISTGARGAAVQPYDARIVSATLKVFTDEKLPGRQAAIYEMKSARNEFAPFQVALNAARDVRNASVAVGDLVSVNGGKIRASASALYLAETVTIETASNGEERKVWPDPLPPYHIFDVPAGQTRSVWVDLFIPRDAKPGVYSGPVTVSADGVPKIELKISVDVREPVIPDKPSLSTAFGISYGSIRAAHKVEKDGPEAAKLGDAYYWMLVNHRLSPYGCPVDFFSPEANRYYDDPRVTSFRAPYTENDEEMRKIADRIKSAGWINKAVFYVRDEPTLQELPEVTRIGRRIHSFLPDARYLITTAPNPPLDYTQIQIWCPVIQFLVDPIRMKTLMGEQKKGKDFWWYTCIGPKWKGTTYFIDEAATAPRQHPWMNFLYGVSGILYWETTSWGRANEDPWTTTMTYPGGNGDGSLLYPGSHVGYDGPVASIRIKMLREGMEDYELLTLLGKRLGEAAARISPAAVAKYKPASRLYEHAFALITRDGRLAPMGGKTPWLMYESTDYRVLEAQRDKVFDEIAVANVSPLLLVETVPGDNAITLKRSAGVRGFAEIGSKVTVNGAPVALASDGGFSTKIKLTPDANNIRITATKNGKEKTIFRVIYAR